MMSRTCLFFSQVHPIMLTFWSTHYQSQLSWSYTSKNTSVHLMPDFIVIFLSTKFPFKSTAVTRCFFVKMKETSMTSSCFLKHVVIPGALSQVIIIFSHMFMNNLNWEFLLRAHYGHTARPGSRAMKSKVLYITPCKRDRLHFISP